MGLHDEAISQVLDSDQRALGISWHGQAAQNETLEVLVVKVLDDASLLTLKKRRNEKEKSKALERDGNICIFLCTVNPDVVHVLPFSSTSSTENTARTNRLWPATIMLLDQ